MAGPEWRAWRSARVHMKPRHRGHTLDELERGSVHVNALLVTAAGEERPFIGKAYLLR